MKSILAGLALAVSLLIVTPSIRADDDTRTKVDLPEMMRTHMLANMRDHLLVVSELQAALAANELDRAADIAETRLGMSSLASHNAAHMAPYMPKSMQDIGTEMHHAASRFAITASEGDLAHALADLSKVTRQCVACHASFRVN
jgi:cytochrome c556